MGARGSWPHLGVSCLAAVKDQQRVWGHHVDWQMGWHLFYSTRGQHSRVRSSSSSSRRGGGGGGGGGGSSSSSSGGQRCKATRACRVRASPSELVEPPQRLSKPSCSAHARRSIQTQAAGAAGLLLSIKGRDQSSAVQSLRQIAACSATHGRAQAGNGFSKPMAGFDRLKNCKHFVDHIYTLAAGPEPTQPSPQLFNKSHWSLPPSP